MYTFELPGDVFTSRNQETQSDSGMHVKILFGRRIMEL